MKLGWFPRVDYVENISDLYRSGVDWYNTKVEQVQRYFANEPMRNEDDFDVYNFLDSLGIPRSNKDELIDYMNRYGLTWSDLKTTKALAMFGAQQQVAYRRVTNFVSSNVKKLYR